jgi:hypothetical protein
MVPIEQRVWIIYNHCICYAFSLNAEAIPFNGLEIVIIVPVLFSVSPVCWREAYSPVVLDIKIINVSFKKPLPTRSSSTCKLSK